MNKHFKIWDKVARTVRPRYVCPLCYKNKDMSHIENSLIELEDHLQECHSEKELKQYLESLKRLGLKTL